MNYTQQNSSDSQIENTRVINSKSVNKMGQTVCSKSKHVHKRDMHQRMKSKYARAHGFANNLRV
jgi:hypothetical protein